MLSCGTLCLLKTILLIFTFLFLHLLLVNIELNFTKICLTGFTAQEHKDVTHSFDTWHGAKNFGKKLGSVSKKHKNIFINKFERPTIIENLQTPPISFWKPL